MLECLQEVQRLSQNYRQLSSEVGALHNVIRETEELLTQEDLTTKQGETLEKSRAGCEEVLRELDKLLDRYSSLGTQSQRTSDSISFGLEISIV